VLWKARTGTEGHRAIFGSVVAKRVEPWRSVIANTIAEFETLIITETKTKEIRECEGVKTCGSSGWWVMK
jgi:hypothetical protein